MAHHNTEQPAVDERGAAPYIGFTRSALRLWRATGRGPAYIKHGRSIRYRISDLDDWIARHRVQTRESGVAEAVGR